jgi:Leucine-rich repeat (LRR) protein
MKKISIIFVTFILLVLFSICAHAAIPAHERAALIALYNSTNGDNWTNNSGWKTGTPEPDGFGPIGSENTWFGITCDGTNSTVLNITQFQNNLVGTIPIELANLSNLKYLILNFNPLTGNIPAELGKLSNLNALSLSATQLTGNIPPELGNLSNLTELFITENQLTGTIPAELGNLSNLTRLFLGGKNLTGEIPPQLGNLTKLQDLYLIYSQLIGNIPPELGNLVNLKSLGLYSNKLSGAIPPQLGNLSNLVGIQVHGNQLSGSIPPELGNLSRLENLNLSLNLLTGSIPPALGSLSNLKRLELHSNRFTGNIPMELGNLSNLTYLKLGFNQLEGSIPIEFGNLSNITYLDLSGNQLTGNIPPQLGQLSQLTGLQLSNNQLTGSIPPELGNLPVLELLTLHWNQLTGTIPPQLGSLTSLKLIGLNNNQLSGVIPAELGNLTNLVQLKINANRLSGTIPVSLTGLTALSVTDIGHNALHTDDAALRAFLDSKDPDWENTQTYAPTELAVEMVSDTSVKLSWTLITFTTGTGGYRVFYRTAPGGSYTLFGTTADKTVSQMEITGLVPDTTYYFVTQTHSNQYNQNYVDSEYSREVSITIVNRISVTSPKTNEVYNVRNIIPVQWTASGLSGNVMISLKRTDGPGDYVINESHPYDSSPLNYIVANDVLRGIYHIEIRQGGFSGKSGNFYIASESSVIKLTSPQKGQAFNRGETLSITWATQMIRGDIKISLVKNDLTSEYIIKTGHPYNQSPVNYVIPNDVAAGTYFIKIEREQGTVSANSGEFIINIP